MKAKFETIVMLISTATAGIIIIILLLSGMKFLNEGGLFFLFFIWLILNSQKIKKYIPGWKCKINTISKMPKAVQHIVFVSVILVCCGISAGIPQQLFLMFFTLYVAIYISDVKSN